MTSIDLLNTQKLIWSHFRSFRVIYVMRPQNYLYILTMQRSLSFFVGSQTQWEDSEICATVDSSYIMVAVMLELHQLSYGIISYSKAATEYHICQGYQETCLALQLPSAQDRDQNIMTVSMIFNFTHHKPLLMQWIKTYDQSEYKGLSTTQWNAIVPASQRF